MSHVNEYMKMNLRLLFMLQILRVMNEGESVAAQTDYLHADIN